MLLFSHFVLIHFSVVFNLLLTVNFSEIHLNEPIDNVDLKGFIHFLRKIGLKQLFKLFVVRLLIKSHLLALLEETVDHRNGGVGMLLREEKHLSLADFLPKLGLHDGALAEVVVSEPCQIIFSCDQEQNGEAEHHNVISAALVVAIVGPDRGKVRGTGESLMVILLNMVALSVFPLLIGAEVCEVKLPIFHHEVTGLDVSVDVPYLVYFLNCLNHLYCHLL